MEEKTLEEAIAYNEEIVMGKDANDVDKGDLKEVVEVLTVLKKGLIVATKEVERLTLLTDGAKGKTMAKGVASASVKVRAR